MSVKIRIIFVIDTIGCLVHLGNLFFKIMFKYAYDCYLNHHRRRRRRRILS
jgi:hypothetical protein